MIIAGIPGISYKKSYENERRMKRIQNPRAKRLLNKFSTHLVLSKHTAARRLSDVSKKINSIKPGEFFCCTVKKHRDYEKISPIIKYSVNG